MKKILKELFLFVFFYTILVSIKNIFFALDNSKYYREITMNVEKEYFFITNVDVFISILIFGYFIIYQLRSFSLKYKNSYSNYVLVVAQIFAILAISFFVSMVFSIKTSVLSLLDSEFFINGVSYDFDWQLIFYCLLICQTILVILLFYNATRIAKNKYVKTIIS